MTDPSELGMKDFGALQTTQKRQKQPPINLIEIKISFNWKKIFRKNNSEVAIDPGLLTVIFKTRKVWAGRSQITPFSQLTSHTCATHF